MRQSSIVGVGRSGAELVGVELSVWPNPATNTLNVTTLTSQQVEIQIIDLLGNTQLTSPSEGPSTTINVAALSSGVYGVRCVGVGGNTSTTILFVKAP